MLGAVFFDMDGVIADTERDGHRVSFNLAFTEFNVDAQWSVDQYHSLLQISGGKERIAHYFKDTHYRGDEYIRDPEGFIKKIHKRKTELYIELIKTGELPLRPGVKRLMKEINREGIILGICTTSAEKAAEAVVESLLKEVKIDFLLAGDIVSKKKPDPEIYHLALRKSGIAPENSFVVEDSRNGVTAAKAAGLKVIATVNPYTEKEDVFAADIVVDSLGEPEGPQSKVLSEKIPKEFSGYIDLDVLKRSM